MTQDRPYLGGGKDHRVDWTQPIYDFLGIGDLVRPTVGGKLHREISNQMDRRIQASNLERTANNDPLADGSVSTTGLADKRYFGGERATPRYPAQQD